jgi:O-antigen/teichoic acid export membrane protein
MKWTSVSTIVVVALQFLQLTVLARLLSPGDFGLASIVWVVIGFAQGFSDMGISNSIIYRQGATHEELSSLYWLNLLAGAAVFALVWAATPLVVSFYGEPRLRGLMFWAALIFLVVPVGQQFQILLQKELMFGRLAQIEVLAAIIGAVVATASVLLAQGALSLVWGQLAAAAAKSALFARVGFGTWRPSLHFQRSDLKGHLSFGLYQMGERSLNYLAQNTDKLLIGKLLGTEVLGYYSVASQMMLRPVQMLNPIVTRVAFPVLSRFQTDDARLRLSYLRVIQAVAFIGMPVYLGLFVVADPLMNLLLGAGWDPAVGVFRILVLIGLMYCLGNPLGSLLLAKGRADIGFWTNLCVLPLYVVAILIGSLWGVNGVAWSLVALYWILLFPAEFWIQWHLVRMRPVEYVGSFAPFLAFSVLMAVTVAVIDKLVEPGSDVVRLSVSGALGVAVYLGSVWVLKKPLFKEIVLMVRGESVVLGGK